MVLQRVSNKHNIQHNEILKSYYSSEESEESHNFYVFDYDFGVEQNSRHCKN